MVFSSSVFLFLFLPVTLAVYYIVRSRRARNVWLLIASLVFYAWGEPVYVALMVVSILVNWAIAFRIGRSERGSSQAKCWLAAAVVFNLLVIGFFKYEGFLARSVNALVGADVVLDLQLPLPIGISFYTLQALSYVIDVYRGDAQSQRNVLYLGMYVSCFPQLIAGPIVRYRTVADQILNRRETLDDFVSGLRLFSVGLAKKAILANTVAILADGMLALGGEQIGVVGAWAGIIAYTLQIYFDFSGYSDMAIGLGRMMGFHYLRNFNYPYTAICVSEFWRRWHISLYAFFRDYVYIPLGGSRVSTGRWLINIAVVWALTGLWHGAAWNFVFWGVYYGVLLACEKLIWGRALTRLPRPVGHVYTVACFMFGWLIFWISEPSQFCEYLSAMFGFFGLTGTSTLWELTAWAYWPLLIICIVACLPTAPWLKERLCAWAEGRPARKLSEGILDVKALDATPLCASSSSDSARQTRASDVLEILWNAIALGLFILAIAFVVAGTFNPFIYFQF